MTCDGRSDTLKKCAGAETVWRRSPPPIWKFIKIRISPNGDLWNYFFTLGLSSHSSTWAISHVDFLDSLSYFIFCRTHLMCFSKLAVRFWVFSWLVDAFEVYFAAYISLCAHETLRRRTPSVGAANSLRGGGWQAQAAGRERANWPSKPNKPIHFHVFYAGGDNENAEKRLKITFNY